MTELPDIKREAYWISRYPGTLSVRKFRAARVEGVVEAYPYGRGFGYSADQVVAVLEWLRETRARADQTRRLARSPTAHSS